MTDKKKARNKKKVSEQFPELFHYTNLTAFKNIFETNILRATHYRDLNDSSEFARFKLKVLEYIRPIMKKILNDFRYTKRVEKYINERGGIELAVEKDAAWHVDSVHESMFKKEMYQETFVCSFCGHNLQSYESGHGLLSQWRAYGAGGGVAIVLDTVRVEEMMIKDYANFQFQRSMMGKVIYDDNDSEIKKEYKKVFKSFPKIIEIYYNNQWVERRSEVEKLYTDMHKDFLLGSVLVKHRAFQEENEIRSIVSLPTEHSYSYGPDNPKMKKQIWYMLKDNREIRYIEMFGNEPLPIKRIIVGPSRIQNFNYQTVRDIIGEDTNIEIVKSGIPFLG
jgi:hypothetical protein